MNPPAIHPGEYILARWSGLSDAVADIKDGKVVISLYTTARSQVWNIQPSHGMWTIQNSMSGKYMGIRQDESLRNWLEVSEVDHPFPWRLEGEGGSDYLLRLGVPYSKYYLAIAGSNPSHPLFLYEWETPPPGGWGLFRPHAPPLEDGGSYKIVNHASSFALHLTEEHEVRLAARDPQIIGSYTFIAIKTPIGWAFKHQESGLYLSVPPTTMTLPAKTRLQVGTHKCSWMILPAVIDGDDSPPFKIFLPYTPNVICPIALDMNTVVLGESDDKPFKQWRFEQAFEIGPPEGLNVPGPRQ